MTVQSLLSICVLKGLDGGEFSFKIEAQHGPYQ